MGYILKEDVAELVKEKYKTNYIATKLGLSNCYVSLILHRRRKISKHVAYSFVKLLNSEAEINDYFILVRK